MKLKMRNLATCYSEHAIKVSDSYCSGNHSNQIYLHNSSPTTTFIPTIQDEVSSLYKLKLTSKTHLLITLTWSTHSIDVAFSISINEHHSNSSKSFHFRKIKGSKKLEPFDSKIELIWDLTKATYELGPEPVKGYFLALLVNSQMILIGDDVEDLELKKLVFSYPFAKSSLVSRIERFSGAEYSSRAKFFDTGTWHDIVIRCVADDLKAKSSLSLSVCIDKKNVIQVKRLRWNFRGNQTVFLDGMLVDLMWDVHDWFFDSDSGSKSRSRAGIFLFRPRSGLDSRLWFEEKNLGEDEQERVGSSLLICACKTPD